jgi:hypothetical protein
MFLRRRQVSLQRKIVRIMAGAQPRARRKILFKQLNILPAPCQCTLSLMNVINSIPEIVKTNSSVYRNNTRKLIFSRKFHSALASEFSVYYRAV